MAWCILRTASRRTLELVEKLKEAGIEAWTPAKVHRKRLPRRRTIVEVEAPILPSFAFARAADINWLLAMSDSPNSPCPDFSVFMQKDRVPVVSEDALGPLRLIEEREAAKLLRERAKSNRKARFKCGDPIRVEAGPFGGLSGIVKSDDGKFTLVSFAGFEVKISSFILAENLLGSEQPNGSAAKAA
jgi:hypothetical protein